MPEHESDEFLYFSSGLMAAARSEEHAVELTYDGSGAQVEIDGVAVFDDIRYPAEQFNIATGDNWQHHVTDSGREKLREVKNGA